MFSYHHVTNDEISMSPGSTRIPAKTSADSYEMPPDSKTDFIGNSLPLKPTSPNNEYRDTLNQSTKQSESKSPIHRPYQAALHYKEKSQEKHDDLNVLLDKQELLKSLVMASLGKFGYKDDKLMDYIHQIKYFDQKDCEDSQV